MTNLLLIILITVFSYGPVSAQMIESETNTNNETTDKTTSIAAKKVAKKINDPRPVIPPANMIPKNLIFFGDESYFSKYVVLADKGTRTLTVWQRTAAGPELVKSYTMDMGKNSGDKVYLGDKRTPEGVYFFQTTYNANQLNFDVYGEKAFTTNYPNLFDRRVKKTGSGIWLHSVPPKLTLLRGSRGCVTVRIAAIHEIGNFIKLKTTPFIISNTVEYIPRSIATSIKEKSNKWLRAWRDAWQDKDLEGYMSYYSDSFYSFKMRKPKWKSYKKYLNTTYEYIKVKLSEPLILKEKDTIIYKFVQSYESNVKSDYGIKTLYIKEEGPYFKIIAEKWEPLKTDHIAFKEDN